MEDQAYGAANRPLAEVSFITHKEQLLWAGSVCSHSVVGLDHYLAFSCVCEKWVLSYLYRAGKRERASVETSSKKVYSSVFPPPGSGDSANALMEAERSGGVSGGTNQSPAGSGAGRNPNGPKVVLGPAPTAATGAMAGSSQPRDPQDGDAGLLAARHLTFHPVRVEPLSSQRNTAGRPNETSWG